MLSKKKLQIIIISLIAVILLASIILFISFNFLKIHYNTNEKAEINSSITIIRDSKGIPSINTDSINDFYFALGYLHAKDRLNLIDYLRSIATADSAKFAGSDSALLNNLCNTIGFTKNADEIAGKLKEKDMLVLKSYVNGINHVRSKNHVRNLISREWRVEDVLAILSMKEWANSYLNNKELIFNLPDSKISDSKNLFKDNRYLYFYNEDDIQYLYTLRRMKEIIEKYICSFARGNSIYISPEYTVNGSDTFLTLNYEDSSNSYPGWYPVKLILNGETTLAVTYSGLPFILSFKNSSISLTQININADNQNFYLFDTEYKEGIPHYKTAGTWKEYQSVRIPSFKTNEIASEIKWVTEKGPVFSELINSAKIKSRIMVIDSIQPGIDYLNMLLQIPFEKDTEKIKQAISLNDSSFKCFILTGDKKAYKIFSGFINQTDNNNQVFINGSNSLKAPISRISLVKQISGLDYCGSDLTSQNDISNNFKNTITNEFKKDHFNSILVKKNIYDDDRIKNIITDHYSITAEKFTPIFTTILQNNLLPSSKLSKIYFSDWNYSMKSGLQSPSIFYSVLEYFINESYKNDFGKDSEFNLNSSYLLFSEFYNHCQSRNTPLFDNPETINVESKETVFDIAFLNSMRFLNRNEGPFMENWKWGSVNKSKFKIPNERLDFFSRFFHIEDRPLSGGPDTIENIIQNNKFTTVSSTSFQSIISNETIKFKMNCGYSTSKFSEFYYGSNTIDNFENMNISAQEFKTVITNK